MASPEPDSSQNLDSVLPPSRGRKQPPSGLPLQGSGKHQGSPSSKVKTRPRSEQDSPELGSMSDPHPPNPAKRRIHRATRQYGAGAETKAQQPSSPLAGGVRSDSKRGSAPPTVGRGSPAPTILAQQGHPGGGTEVEAGSPQVRQAEDKAAKRRSVHLATRPYGAPREEPVPETPPNPVVDEGRSPEGKKRSLLSVIPSKLLRRGRSSYRPNNLSKAPPAPFSIEAAYLPANQGGEKANPEKSKGYDGLPSVMMSMGMSSQGEIVASSTAWGGESDLNNTEMALDDGAHEVEEEVEDGAAFQRERPVPVSESKFYPSMVMEEKEESEVSWDGVYQAPRRGEWSGLARYEPKKKGSVDEEYSRNLGNPLESISDLDMSEVVGIAVPLSDAQGSPARPTGKSRFGTVSGKSPKGAVGTGKAMGDDEVVNEMELQRQKWDEQLTAEQKHQIVVDEGEIPLVTLAFSILLSCSRKQRSLLQSDQGRGEDGSEDTRYGRQRAR